MQNYVGYFIFFRGFMLCGASCFRDSELIPAFRLSAVRHRCADTVIYSLLLQPCTAAHRVDVRRSDSPRPPLPAFGWHILKTSLFLRSALPPWLIFSSAFFSGIGFTMHCKFRLKYAPLRSLRCGRPGNGLRGAALSHIRGAAFR